LLQLGSVGRSKRRGSAPMAEINIIPLVDVTLVLLIIFMATTAFVKEAGINMKLPTATTQEFTPQQNHDLNIALTRAGGIYLDGKASSEEQVQSAMQARARNNAATRVVIKGDEKIEYARVVRVMDLARQAGLPRVALGTRSPESR
jgi:biopolymer transport protein ExbD